MTRMLTLVALLTACDPIVTPGGGTGDPVQYNTAPCDSIAETAATPSTDIDAPTVFEVGQIVGGRIDPDATTNFRHFWDVDLPRGTYHLVVDNYTADGSSTNIGLEINQLDAVGVEIDRLIGGNEIDHRTRLHTVVVAESNTTLRLEVNPKFGIEDYLIGVFENATPVPSPYFESCPPTTPLVLDTPLDFTLDEEALEDADEVWLTFDADPGDYTFTIDAEQVGGTSTNLIYDVDVVDRFGQAERYVDVMRANEIDISARLQGSFSVGEAASYWVRIINGHDALDLSVTLTED